MTEKPEADSVSLAPLTPEEALRALLAVNPDDEPKHEDDDGPVQEEPQEPLEQR